MAFLCGQDFMRRMVGPSILMELIVTMSLIKNMRNAASFFPTKMLVSIDVKDFPEAQMANITCRFALTGAEILKLEVPKNVPYRAY